MDIIIAGKNNIAINVCDFILNNINCNVYVIFNKTDFGIDSFQRSFRKYAQNKKLHEININEAMGIKNCIFISLEFDVLIEPHLFKTDSLFNLHFSLLPAYKGMYTSCLPIMYCEEITGVTLHKIDKGIDTGDIIAQNIINISEDETAKSLYLKYIKYGTELVIKYMNEIIFGNYKSMKQSYINSSYHSKLHVNYGKIEFDLNKTAYQLMKNINSFIFRDYQLPKVLGREIIKCKIDSEKSTLPAGMVFYETDNLMKIATIDYNLILYKDRLDFLFKCIQENEFEKFKITINTNNNLLNEKNK